MRTTIWGCHRQHAGGAVAGATHANTTVSVWVSGGQCAAGGGDPGVASVLWPRYRHRQPPLTRPCASRWRGFGAADPEPEVAGGSLVFTHESGLHVDGLPGDRQNYQGVDPALLGREHRLVLGKHSGRHGVIAVFQRLGYALSAGEADALLARLRGFTEQYKRNPIEAGYTASIERSSRLATKPSHRRQYGVVYEPGGCL